MRTKEEKERLDKFYDELTALTNKYNIKIEGCGCCGSPYLVDIETFQTLDEYVNYNKDEREYEKCY